MNLYQHKLRNNVKVFMLILVVCVLLCAVVGCCVLLLAVVLNVDVERALFTATTSSLLCSQGSLILMTPECLWMVQDCSLRKKRQSGNFPYHPKIACVNKQAKTTL